MFLYKTSIFCHIYTIYLILDQQKQNQAEAKKASRKLQGSFRRASRELKRVQAQERKES